MQEAAVFTADEQKYFDTRGADGPANDGTPPAAAPEPTPEPVAADPAKQPEKEAEQPDNPGQFIRRADYEKEVGHRKNLDRALREERERNAERSARLEERLAILAQNLQPEPPQQPADPIQTLQELNQWKHQQEAEKQRAYQVEQQQHAFYSEVTKRESQFAQEHPDYYEAVEYAKQARIEELKSFGIFDETRIANILAQDIQGISVEALQSGGNPAEVFYNFAMHRGFKTPQPAQAQQKPNGAAEKLERIAAGQNAGKSLGAASGAATPALTLENLANMPDDEFRKIASDKAQWRKLMGG